MCNKLFKKCYSHSFALFFLRLVVGGIFLSHGISKFQNFSGTVGFFESLGLGSFSAGLVSVVETLGGIALILGVFVKPLSFLLFIVMVVASYLKLSGTISASAELDLVLLAVTLFLSKKGSGPYSLAKFCKCGCHKEGGDCKVCNSIGCGKDSSIYSCPSEVHCSK